MIVSPLLPPGPAPHPVPRPRAFVQVPLHLLVFPSCLVKVRPAPAARRTPLDITPSGRPHILLSFTSLFTGRPPKPHTTHIHTNATNSERLGELRSPRGKLTSWLAGGVGREPDSRTEAGEHWARRNSGRREHASGRASSARAPPRGRDFRRDVFSAAAAATTRKGGRGRCRGRGTSCAPCRAGWTAPWPRCC